LPEEGGNAADPVVALDGSTALVTGASGGIGRAIALALAERGADLWLVARGRDELEAAAREVRAGAPRVEVRPTDLTADDQVERLAAELNDPGRLDVLVHSAGVMALGPMEGAALSDFDAQYATNVRGVYALTQALLPALKTSRGQVVFMNSTAALHPGAGVGQYAATSAAVRVIADSLRDEINEDGVRVLSVFPGRTATPRQKRIHAGEGRDYLPERLMQPSDVARMVVAALELPRTAEVTELSMRPFLKPL
jgi:NADP-dependent 3-hydroxy acid dehydrogenase YdfG